MTVVAGLLTFLAMNRAYYYRSSKANRVRNVALAVADSAANYARMHLETWKLDPPAEPIELEVEHLLLPKMTGSATVSFVDADDRTICRVTAKVSQTPVSVVDQIDIEIN
jgi:hypothetical protein